MEFRQILELLGMAAVTSGIGIFFYFYFTNSKMKTWVNTVVRNIPLSALLSFAASKVEDKKGEFDAHDALVIAGRLSDFFRNTITDPNNTSFEDVEEEVFIFLERELDRYREAAVKGVPNISDEVLRTNVRVVFEQIKRALSEDPS